MNGRGEIQRFANQRLDQGKKRCVGGGRVCVQHSLLMVKVEGDWTRNLRGMDHRRLNYFFQDGGGFNRPFFTKWLI